MPSRPVGPAPEPLVTDLVHCVHSFTQLVAELNESHNSND